MLTGKVVKELRPHPDRKQWIKADHDRGADDDRNQTCRGFGVKIMQSGTKTMSCPTASTGRKWNS